MTTEVSAENSLTFLGAAREVTGSCHLLQSGGVQILLDCGMHQGGDTVKRLAREKFPFRPAAIDAVVLSHAHLDHSGLLPMLVQRGFSGRIYCTPGTISLLEILLRDSYHLYIKDLEYENKRHDRAGHKRHDEAKYTEEDVDRVMELCFPLEYGSEFYIADHIRRQLHDAGHILGASIVELLIKSREGDKTLVFSGDLGNPETSLMPAPESLSRADIVLMESTYGDRDHRSMRSTLAEFASVLEDAAAGGGNILIPSFAVGRAQELLFQLGKLYHQGRLEGWTVFLDSPMASAVTGLYNHYRNILDPADVALMERNGSCDLTHFLPVLNITDDVESSRAINTVEHGAIIIAGSGMCTGGRIRHHFKHRLWKSSTHVLIVGYQANGTLGRLLVDGVDRIKLFGQNIAVKAHIHTLGGFSAHAGQGELLAWAGAFETSPAFYLVHGEPAAMETLKSKMRDEQGIDADMPEQGESIEF
ncbi:MAG: MBL fold metallo-hydrolase [Gammaproteobacteria bacterium]